MIVIIPLCYTHISIFEDLCWAMSGIRSTGVDHCTFLGILLCLRTHVSLDGNHLHYWTSRQPMHLSQNKNWITISIAVPTRRGEEIVQRVQLIPDARTSPRTEMKRKTLSYPIVCIEIEVRSQRRRALSERGYTFFQQARRGEGIINI